MVKCYENSLSSVLAKVKTCEIKRYKVSIKKRLDRVGNSQLGNMPLVGGPWQNLWDSTWVWFEKSTLKKKVKFYFCKMKKKSDFMIPPINVKSNRCAWAGEETPKIQ